ncbi:MAG: UDP-N-acetylmuramoyl-tripeptide--D-alanyl-D-alanine ligase [Thermomicrobiales bacterium]|nr:UDP-N-acetylmuramoyl-tripeptide--D-alanyl-D-alanine ligase [Thermomicrobiales bacterium]
MSTEFSPQQPITLTEILTATNAGIIGDLAEGTTFRWIERNSRSIAPGDLFIAVKGERFDGHAFVDHAAGQGASAALVSRSWTDERSGPAPLPLLVVDDPVLALQQVAAARRQSMPLTVIGVTGSLGKTSTKESIAAALSPARRVYRSPGNMNSEIGLPLSLLEIPVDTDVAVLEMGGAYALGELALLAGIGKPQIGVVTNVMPIHLERMGTIEAIAETKTELVAALPADGFAILNVANPWVAAMAERSDATVLSYAIEHPAMVMGSDVRTFGLDGIAFQLEGEAGSRRLALPMAGVHSAELALAAICAGLATGVSVDQVIDGLSRPGVQVRLVPMPGPNGSRLIDDTYNASAPSVLSALRLLQEIPASRRIAVLGDMRELGDETAAQHEAVGSAVAGVADLLFTFGDMARQIAASARDRAVDANGPDVTSFGVDQRDALTSALLAELRPGDVALLKGSRGLEMETIVASLRNAVADSPADA